MESSAAIMMSANPLVAMVGGQPTTVEENYQLARPATKTATAPAENATNAAATSAGFYPYAPWTTGCWTSVVLVHATNNASIPDVTVVATHSSASSVNPTEKNATKIRTAFPTDARTSGVGQRIDGDNRIRLVNGDGHSCGVT